MNVRENPESHPCMGCEYFDKLEITSVEGWDITIPVCSLYGYTLALGKCKQYEEHDNLQKQVR